MVVFLRFRRNASRFRGDNAKSGWRDRSSTELRRFLNPSAAFGAAGPELQTERSRCAPCLPWPFCATLASLSGCMLDGVEAAQGKQGEKKRAAGVVKVAQAANAYGKHFDHAGWQAIKLPH